MYTTIIQNINKLFLINMLPNTVEYSADKRYNTTTNLLNFWSFKKSLIAIYNFKILLNVLVIKKIYSREFLILQKRKLRKKKLKKDKTPILRMVKFLIPDNYIINIVGKNYYNTRIFSWFYKRYKTPIPQLIWSSIRNLEPIIILHSLIFSLNKTHFSNHRRIIKRIISTLMLIVWQLDMVCGFEFLIVGKISVGGNARTRTLNTLFGVRARSKLWLAGKKINDIVYSVTGCLGISLFWSF